MNLDIQNVIKQQNYDLYIAVKITDIETVDTVKSDIT